MSEQQFDWGPLGESWWRENGAACRASEKQIKFACSRHQGAHKNRAAELAGYSGDPDGLRSAGSRTDGSTAVQDLIALAAATEAGVADNPVTIHEAKRKVGKLVRSPDPAIALKASELFVKLEVAEKNRGEEPESSWEDDTRALLAVKRNGLGLCAMAFLGTVEEYAPRLDLSGIPLFADLAPSIAKTYPELWAKIRALLDSDCQAVADRMAAAAATPIAELVPKTETTPAVEMEEGPSATA